MPDGDFDYASLKPTVDAARVMPWETQAPQYPNRGEPGVRYMKGDIGQGRWVDCLLHYDDNGQLSGILNHYPQDIPPFEKKGRVNIWIRPDRLRQGIGTKLILAALERWELQPEGQNFTAGGAAWAKALDARWQGVRPARPEPGPGDT